MFTCFIKYNIDLTKLAEFEKYARAWIELVEKCGGIHHGYFVPSDELNDLSDLSFSFPDIGKKGADNIAVALFSFSDTKAYESYKKIMADDELCREITKFFNKSKCFLSYERNFLKPIFPNKI